MKRILSIDDESTILRCLENALNAQGYEVTTCNDPEKAFDVLKSQDFALITLDIRMPGKDGFDLYKEFRQYKHIPALFCTAFPKSFNTQSDEIVKMWQEEFIEGTTDIIYKPFDLDDLYAKVEGLIGPANE